jgi:hypothetical protein
MLAILTASLLGGFVLGLRFRVLILVPVIVVCIIVIVGAGIALRAGAWVIAVAVVVHVCGVQIGYLVGICTSFALTPRDNGALGGSVFSFRRTMPWRRNASRDDKA